MQTPKLRNVEKYQPPYRLNDFPKDFPLNLGREIVYHLAARGTPRLMGEDWEEIFARLVGAKWTPSNVGLDDVIYQQCAWGCKTVKNAHPAKTKRVRLISGRNSPAYSFDDKKVKDVDPDVLGQKVLSIWNSRVADVRKKFLHVRTVVLIKSDDLLEVAAFELDTSLFPDANYKWTWNEEDNLEGYEVRSDKTEIHKFTWQPHGSQFTVIEEVPANRLAIKIRKPPELDKDAVLKALEFDASWVQIIK
jgi:hypothetical protein